MPQDQFRFKRFAVTQSAGAGMKVGTDGVLLGAWCRLDASHRRLLDAGTGTGVIALMLAQRTVPQVMVDAVDIDLQSCAQASDNVLESPWHGRIEVINSPLQSLAAGPYDHIVSNPPYFADSLLPPSVSRTTARHTVSLTHDELAMAAASLLAPEGVFSVILPVEEGTAFRRYADIHGLLLRRLTNVRPKCGAAPKRLLMEFGRMGCPLQEEELSITDEDGQFTAEYKALTADFYLKF